MKRQPLFSTPRILPVLLALTLVSACEPGTSTYTFQGDEGDEHAGDTTTVDGNDTTVNNDTVTVGTDTSNPTGTIQGLVLDDQTGDPLAGVGVSCLAGDAPTSVVTDANGAYFFQGVPASSSQLALRYTLAGYTSVTAEVVVGVKDGLDQYEIDNFIETVNVRMFPMTAGLKGTVLTASRGQGEAPAPNAEIVVTTNGNALIAGPTSSAAAVATFQHSATGTTGADGSFQIDALPGGGAVLGSCVILPYDADGNGVTDYDAVAITVGAGVVGGNGAEGVPGDGTVPLFPDITTDVGPINLNDGADAVTVIYTSIDGGGTVNSSDSILVVFSDDIRPDSLVVVISTPSGDLVPSYSLALNTLTIQTAGLEAGNHTLKLVTYEAIDGAFGGPTNLNFTLVGVDLPPPATVTPIAPDTDGDGLVDIDYSTTGITLSFDAVPGAAGYYVYGAVTDPSDYDNDQDGGGEAPRHFVPLTLAASDDTLMPQIPVNLGNTFNVLTNLGTSNPFLGGQKITLAVVPVDPAGRRGPIPDAQAGAPGSHTFQDNVTPSLLSLKQNGSCDNGAGTDPVIFTLVFTFSEPLDPATSFSITWTNGGSTAGTDFIGSTAPFKVEGDETGKTWTLSYSVPAGADWSGDAITNMQAMDDTSGNSTVLPPANEFCGMDPFLGGPFGNVNLYPKPALCQW